MGRTQFDLSLSYVKYTESTFNVTNMVIRTINSVNINQMEAKMILYKSFCFKKSPPSSSNSGKAQGALSFTCYQTKSDKIVLCS